MMLYAHLRWNILRYGIVRMSIAVNTWFPEFLYAQSHQTAYTYSLGMDRTWGCIWGQKVNI